MNECLVEQSEKNQDCFNLRCSKHKPILLLYLRPDDSVMVKTDMVTHRKITCNNTSGFVVAKRQQHI